MIHHRFGRSFVVVGTVFIIFIFSIQLLRFQAVSASTSHRSTVSSTWSEWMWPTYETGILVGEDEFRDGEIGLHPEAKATKATTKDGWSQQTTTLPVPTETRAHKMPMLAVETPAEPSKEAAATPDENEPMYPDTAWHSYQLPDLNTTFQVPDNMEFNPKGPRPDQVILLTATDGKGHNGGIENILEQTAGNRKQFCDYHGYRNHFVNISKYDLGNVHPVWKKIPAIIDAFNSYPDAQWIFFLDLDAIIMTPKQDLNSLVLSHEGMRSALALGSEYLMSGRTPLGLWTPAEPDFENLDLLIAQDQNGINAGSFFLRRSKFTQWLLDMWADPFFMGMDWAGQEQEALLHLLKHHPIIREHTGLLKQRVANAFSEGDKEMRWTEGDLVVHLAGCWVTDACQERWADMWSRRGSV